MADSAKAKCPVCNAEFNPREGYVADIKLVASAAGAIPTNVMVCSGLDGCQGRYQSDHAMQTVERRKGDGRRKRALAPVADVPIQPVPTEIDVVEIMES